MHTRAYVFNQRENSWQYQGVVIENGFWPLVEPRKLDDGNWIISGLCVGDGNPAAVAISHGENLREWDLVKIPRSADLGEMWGESTVINQGSHVINIARYGKEAHALVASSHDYGRTWSPSSVSNMPMVTSKPCAGTLSTGQHYLIGSVSSDGGKRRSPLTIAVSRPGEMKFSRLWVIRHAEFPNGPGESHPNAALSYPYATEHDGKLYVGYSNNGGNVGRTGQGRERANNNSAELAIIPIEKLRVN